MKEYYEDYMVLIKYHDNNDELEVLFSTRDDDEGSDDEVYFYINGENNLIEMLASEGVDFDVLAYYRKPTTAEYEDGISNEFDCEYIRLDWNIVMKEADRIATIKHWTLSSFIDWLADEYSGGCGLDTSYEVWNALKECVKEKRDGYNN